MVGKKYLDNLDALRRDIIDLSKIASKSLGEALAALEKRDTEGYGKVFELEDKADGIYTEIQEECINMIALHQPVASDLRFLAAALSVASHLERIADYSVDIVKVIPYVSEEKRNIRKVFVMGEIARDMTIKSAQAFVNKNEGKVRHVMRSEEQINEHYKSIFPELYTCVFSDKKADKRAHNGCFILGMNMLLVSRALERVGDHAVDIVNKTMYAIKGEKEYL